MSPIKTGWSRDHIFSSAWVASLSPVPALSYAATMELYTIDRGSPVFDPVTGKYTGGARTVVWHGPCRVQHRRSPRNTTNSAADTEVQTVQFQFSGLHVDVATNMYVSVTECLNNPTLIKYRYVVDGVADSSNLIERTILTHVDLEVRK